MVHTARGDRWLPVLTLWEGPGMLAGCSGSLGTGRSPRSVGDRGAAWHPQPLCAVTLWHSAARGSVEGSECDPRACAVAGSGPAGARLPRGWPTGHKAATPPLWH